jgi:hypothetical protein
MNKFERVASAEIELQAGFVIIRSPITFLSRLIETDELNNLILGVVMTGFYLERTGLKCLKEYFAKNNIPYEHLYTDWFSFGSIYRWLLGFKIIDNKLNTKIGEVRKFRNKLLHKIDLPDLIDKKEARKIIETAIECLKALGEK